MLHSTNIYQTKRNAFYKKIPDFWHDLYNKEYSLYHAFPISSDEVSIIHQVSERVGELFFKTAKLLRQLPDETLLQLGMPKETLSFVRHKVIQPESIIARLDLVKTNDGYKVLEINSDTPTFIKECFSINQKVCDHFGLKNPNEGFERQLASAIRKAIHESYKAMNLDRPANIVFTAHSDHSEDWNTTRYLQKISNVPANCIPLHELLINEHGVFDSDGCKIDVLYRQTYPLEHLIHDKDERSGDKVGIQLLKLVMEGKLAIVNPISSFLIQSKAVQALIWGLFEENHEFFSDEEKEWIQSYMLPTYLEPDSFLGNTSYVQKPSFGREGDTVKIYAKNRDVLLEDVGKNYEDELPIYQKFVELPSIHLQTEQGNERLNYMFGSFLIAGKASAIGIRAGGQITGNESYFLPIGIPK
ncbi:glutathionylspermidine synthase family protein [Ferdinandcohnia quinoae]|uniref:Glutathionylspermidine synthase family protein n=1 Tax=Fredinandcohnia quinoae TaxID=2918902 RepID=A0AAW5E0R3_9BACI|nr:glutathionylspermidine synthase family protein [Fredinandcohnia sp. SECRCQ15]MCH1624289.1 glutathionylspermidine synthase family protein [Fredinandcohnia sp. SECRCQ15]